MRSLLFLGIVLFAAAASAEPGGITSAYTKLDLDACKAIDSGEEAAWMEWECDGYGGLPLFVQSGDDRYDLDAGARDEDEHWAATFDYPGDTVEWRLQGGKPFAIIYRLRNANPDRPASSMLIVESVGDGAKLGCRVAEIDGSKADANVLARKAADALLADPAACLKGE
jgi:hypothetical protein